MGGKGYRASGRIIDSHLAASSDRPTEKKKIAAELYLSTSLVAQEVGNPSERATIEYKNQEDIWRSWESVSPSDRIGVGGIRELGDVCPSPQLRCMKY